MCMRVYVCMCVRRRRWRESAEVGCVDVWRGRVAVTARRGGGDGQARWRCGQAVAGDGKRQRRPGGGGRGGQVVGAAVAHAPFFVSKISFAESICTERVTLGSRRSGLRQLGSTERPSARASSR
jgi:hypothetical protein